MSGGNAHPGSTGGHNARRLRLRCHSRAQVVDVMNDISKAAGRGKNYSVPTLEKWVANEERGQLPNLWNFEVLQLAIGKMQIFLVL